MFINCIAILEIIQKLKTLKHLALIKHSNYGDGFVCEIVIQTLRALNQIKSVKINFMDRSLSYKEISDILKCLVAQPSLENVETNLKIFSEKESEYTFDSKFYGHI